MLSLILCGAILATPANTTIDSTTVDRPVGCNLGAVRPQQPPPTAVPGQSGKAPAVLKAWLATYRKGKYDYGDILRNIAGKSLAKKAGIVAKDAFGDRGALKPGQFCYQEEYELLLDEAEKANNKAAAEALLEAASIGLDTMTTYTGTMGPHVARHEAELRLGKITQVDARRYIEEAAKGNIKVNKKMLPALQAAALMALARFQDKAYKPIFVSGLQAADPLVRSHAATALGYVAEPAEARLLVDAIEKETGELARLAQLQAFIKINNDARGAIDQPTEDRLANALAKTVGSGSWRQDQQLLDVLATLRSAAAIPKIIDLLARYVEKPEQLESGELSGLVRTKAHEVLTAYTEQKFTADDVDAWRKYWAEHKDGFKLPKQRFINKPPVQVEGVFGIPISGSSIVFVLDSSSSMDDGITLRDSGRYPHITALIKKGKLPRSVAVRAEVAKAIAGLPETTNFNIILVDFCKPVSWQKDGQLVPAKPANKKAAEAFLKKLQGQGKLRYNAYDALDLALTMKNLTYGQSFGRGVDELFLIASNQPSHEFGQLRSINSTLATINAMNQFSRVRFHTVFVGSDNDPDDKHQTGKSFLKQLADLSGGKFVTP